MYIVKIVNKKNSQLPAGPTFWTGSGEEHEKLIDGISAAQEWINDSSDPEGYEIEYRVVGCL